MMIQIIKKQCLMIWRNPAQLFLLIGLPIVFILILGTALNQFFEGETMRIQTKIAIIEHNSELEQADKFIQEMGKEAGLKKEQVASLKENLPIQRLKSLFYSKELSDTIDIKEVSEDEKDEILHDNTYSAIIEVPEDFTYTYLAHMIKHKKKIPQLRVIGNEQQQISVEFIQGIIENFQRQLTLSVFMSENKLDEQAMNIPASLFANNRTTMDQHEPISAKSYYTVGMAVMNALFVASTIGIIGFREKETFVFNRIILANVSRWIYFSGVLLSTVIFAFLQLLIIFSFSWLVFKVTWPNLFAFFLITIAFSMAVGGIAVLLTAISYRMHTERITNFFSSAIVAIMALIGGSFFPIGDSSEVVRKISELTPNGAGMVAYLSTLRGNDITDVSMSVIYLCLFGVIMIILAAFTFPKRGETM
ncbi:MULTISPECIES: ABC transporter permease [Clostridia]|uniref:ABC transporter permease n=1 Tax=Clostridia TaxID=186801 RepID=UPI000EA29DD2|nr:MULTISPECIES: ABC transporter permease [Clostridia]NBJ69073.1 ABC transporter permease [Roseburia sp. 1XD42-34]RKI79500.1 ABC transporter permease [Clostridium sp. 1xD42-85]